MESPDPGLGAVPLEISETAVRNLREQVVQLELTVLAQQAELQGCAQRAAMFEHAAAERLRVIEQGDQLLQAQRGVIAEWEQTGAELQRRADALAREGQAAITAQVEEREANERVRREAGRAMEELAGRERALMREILELRDEGLLHSIIRRISNIFL